MKLDKRIALSCLLTLTAMGCTINNAPNSPKEVNISQVKESEPLYVAKVSDKQGATISFRINTPVSGFNTKANTNGVPAKTATDVDHYLVYLIKNSTTTGYPAGGDPLVTDKIAGPFTIPNAGAATKTVRFTNIPISTPNAYYVAVRAQDAANVDIIKDNNGSVTPWAANTVAITPKVALSTGSGIVVDNLYAVSSPTALAVSVLLLDAIGAQIQSDITPTSGGTPPPVNAS